MELRNEFLTSKKDVLRVKAESKAVEMQSKQLTSEINREFRKDIDKLDIDV